jgi:hypothetical protein
VLYIFWWLVYLAPITSAVMLVFLWRVGELGSRSIAALTSVFAVAGYFQFWGHSALITAGGLGAQTLLAVGLLLRWRFVE